MAYVVRKPRGRWELRESRPTPAGPRSNTLGTFRTLTTDVIEHVQSRSSRELRASDIIAAALRAGAPVASSPVEEATRTLVTELAAGREPSPISKRLLISILGVEDAGLSDSARSAAIWIAASPKKRAKTLMDLLLLADRLPARTLDKRLFPRISSEPE